MKRVSNNYQCINVSNETYTGKEMSPKGLGYSAVGFDIGFEKEGVDKQLWVVQMKNNKKVWFRKSGMPKVTHEEPLISTITPIVENKKEEVLTETPKKEDVKQKSDFCFTSSFFGVSTDISSFLFSIIGVMVEIRGSS